VAVRNRVRPLFREHDDEILPRELIAAGVVVSALAVVLGLGADEQSRSLVWRWSAHGFVLNVLSNLTLVGPGLIVTEVAVRLWRRRRHRSVLAEPLRRLHGIVDLAIMWSDQLLVKLGEVDYPFMPHRGEMPADNMRTLNAQLELLGDRSRALIAVPEIYAIAGVDAPTVRAGTLPPFAYGSGSELVRDAMVCVDAATGASTEAMLAGLEDRVEKYDAMCLADVDCGSAALAAGKVLNSVMWLLATVSEGLPSQARSLLEVDFEASLGTFQRRLQGDETSGGRRPL
jgi:hypothetical protein